MGEDQRPVVGVKFTPVGRVHRLVVPDAIADVALGPGDQVVVRTSAGQACGTVVPAVPVGNRRLTTADCTEALIRRATADDIVAHLKIKQRERLAHQYCLLRIRERGLAMKLTGVEQLADGSRLVFFFTADGRVDFRELVRDLAAEFRCRIEMRQIGVRDEARMLGGYGSCGRPLCCTTWLHAFEPVSIKMAKQQKLSLNPAKLSGLCGRLKCCLRYELASSKHEGAGRAAVAEGSGQGCGGEQGCQGGCCDG